MIARIFPAKLRRHTSLRPSGPGRYVREPMPCWTRRINAVSSALTRRLIRQLR